MNNINLLVLILQKIKNSTHKPTAMTKIIFNNDCILGTINAVMTLRFKSAAAITFVKPVQFNLVWLIIHIQIAAAINIVVSDTLAIPLKAFLENITQVVKATCGIKYRSPQLLGSEHGLCFIELLFNSSHHLFFYQAQL